MAVSTEPQDPNKGRVLAVDDCATMRALMTASLEALGYSVQAVDSGWAALEAVDHERFDAIVLDVEMPGMDGLELGRTLRQDPRHSRAKLAMHSSLDEEAVRAGFSQYDAFVPKDGRPGILSERVDRLIRGPYRAKDGD
jgi:CheY-like chemotaxis protein